MGTASAVNTGVVQVTCTNGTFGTGWNNSNQFFQGKGNIAALYCQLVHNTGYVSDNLSDPSFRWYQGVIIVDIPTATTETQTVVVQETVTSSVPESATVVETSTATPDTLTPVLDTQTSTVESQPATVPSDSLTVPSTDTQTGVTESSTQTIPSETSTVPVEIPLPTPPPAVEPQPVPAPAPPAPEPPAPQPEPQPQPVPAPEPPPIAEEPPLEAAEPPPAPPEPAEQPPAEPPSAPPVEEDKNEIPLPPAPEAPPAPSPAPLPQPVAEPALTSQPDIAYEPPTVTLDNGVIITQEEAAAIVLLSNPAELISKLFSDPGAVFSALGSVGADMTPEVREESEKVILASVIVGNIATQAAATAGAVAAYRRKP